MNLIEAKQLLNKTGYKLIKENKDPLYDVDIYCEFDGTSDYEEGELPSPYVIVKTESLEMSNLINKHFVEDDTIWQNTDIVSVDMIDATEFEFVMPESDFCDAEMRRDYENLVRSLILKAIGENYKPDDKLGEAKEILKKNGYSLKENNYEVEKVPTNTVYIVIMDGGENDDDYAVFRDILEAREWGDNNCKYDYTVKTSKMF